MYTTLIRWHDPQMGLVQPGRFVTDMKAGPQGIALVSAIINLGHSLKLTVVAEGVETNEQAGVLRELNCDEMQGFLLSTPVSSSCFETRFLSHLGPSDEFIAPCVVRHRRHPESGSLPRQRNSHGQ